MSDSPVAVLVDDSGNLLATTPGTPAASAITIQGDPSGSPIPVSGSFSNPSVGTTGSVSPASASQIGGTDGTNLQAARIFDADSGAGTQFVLGTVLRKSSSGGSVEAGTSSDPLRVDPTGTTTQPISAASLPLPAGASTAAKQPALGTAGTASTDVLTVQGIASMTALKVDGSAVTQPVSATTLPLPTGASTETTLAALNTKINTQGQKAMSASTPVVLASDQSAIPVSGIVTSNIGTTNGLALDATLTGGTQKAIARGGDKGATVAADVTSTAEGTDHQALDIQVYHSGTAINPTAIRALTSSDVVTSVQGTAAALSGKWPVQVTDGTNTAPTMDAAARKGFQAITDGTNTATVKAASTAAVATDTALVVAINPNNSVAITAATLPLPTGAATETTLGTRLADATFTGRINTLGQKTMAASTPVVIASDQSAIPISGTVTATSASTGTNNSAAPSSSTQVGGTDGTNLQAARVFDVDSGAGTQFVLGSILRKSSSGGSVEAGTATDPLRVDPTGTTTQPISATALPLPTGAATETTLGTRLADSTFTGRINTQGQKTMSASTPVVLASDQSSIPVTSTQLPATLVGSRLDSNIGAWLGSTAPSVGSKTSANSIPVVIASDQAAFPTNVVGSHGNAWNATSVAINGLSNSIDCQYTPHISVFGSTSGSSTISFLYSQDNINFYVAATQAIVTGDWGADLTIGARYLKLKSSTARTITATISGKS